MAAATHPTKKARPSLGGSAAGHDTPKGEQEMSASTVQQATTINSNTSPDVPDQVTASIDETDLDDDGYLDADGRPFWIQEPCPAWCQPQLHEGQHHVADRGHRSRWDARFRLSLYSVEWKHFGAEETVDGQEREYTIPVELLVSLEQGHREAEPRVIVEPELRRDDIGGLNLTVAEARQLRDALSTALELAAGGA